MLKSAGYRCSQFLIVKHGIAAPGHLLRIPVCGVFDGQETPIYMTEEI